MSDMTRLPQGDFNMPPGVRAADIPGNELTREDIADYDRVYENQDEAHDQITAANGDKWTGEKQDGFYIYRDKAGNLYESKEVPVYRIDWSNTHCMTSASIAPIEQKSEVESRARKYVRSLRNRAKADYAHAYCDFLLGYGPEPDSRTFDLSFMGAQAVRHQLGDIIPPQP